jgi:hypothetical protein
LIRPVSWTIISDVEQKRKKGRTLNIGSNETRGNHATRMRWNGRLPQQLKETPVGGSKSKARRKKASAITAEKKDISLRNVDQLTKPLFRTTRERAPDRIKKRTEISARRRFMNCGEKKKNETRARGAFLSTSTY